ncbi:MAG: hypothetical protein Q9M33_06245 [Robiginitomaculum sp.]|nr:hypothetical protein [Robiginitomaculum sp.]MDQ7076474.1 hypothetical protein [Robiginitomaculum sp.]
MSVRANAAPVHLNIDHNAFLSAKYSTDQEQKGKIGLRLRRGINGHGHLKPFRTVRLIAYDKDGQMIADTVKRLGKRQTYAHVDVPSAFSKASDISISLH